MELPENPGGGTLNDNAFTFAGAIISLASTDIDNGWLRSTVIGAYQTPQEEAEAVVAARA